MNSKNAREIERRKGADFAYYHDKSRVNTGRELKSTRRPYTPPKCVKGSREIGDRGATLVDE